MPEFLRRILPLMLVVCFAGEVYGQFTREYASWPVIRGGDTLELPFWGGVNSPKPSLVDFDGDSLTDLMIGETPRIFATRAQPPCRSGLRSSTALAT
jgi:hypothetical protein